MRRRGVAAALVAAAVVAVGASGCGAESKSAAVTTAPTVSMWVSGTAKGYRQVAAGVKLALAEKGGRAGPFRVNYAGRQVSDDPAQATIDAVENARVSLRDTQASAVITDAPNDAARQAVTLLNEAGISAVALSDGSLAHEACEPTANVYPAGHATAIAVPGQEPPADFAARFRKELGFAPDAAAWRAYRGAQAVLDSLGAAGVATDDSPPRLDRDALAAALTSAHGDCD